MKKLKVSLLKPGWRFSEPLYIDSETVFLMGKVPLKEKEIERLKKWKVEEVYSDGILLPAENKKSAVVPVQSLKDNKFFAEYSRAISDFSGFIADIRNNISPDAEIINNIVSWIEDKIFSKKDDQEIQDIIAVFNKSYGMGEKYAVSQINCAVISALIGSELEISGDDFRHLITAALIHDIGMLGIPSKIINKKGKLLKEEFDRISMHTVAAYKIIVKELKFPKAVGIIVLQHHEFWNGLGYPRGLKGDDIDLMSRIIAVADSFEAMNRIRGDRDALIAYTAVRNILNGISKKFDASVVKAFIKVLGIYPPGTFVLLNDGSIGKVYKVRKSTPLYPVLILLMDSQGKKTEEGTFLDLLGAKKLFIVKVLSPEELKEKAI